MVTDGPFAETKEYLGGFWIIEAPDLDAALALAKKGSLACAARPNAMTATFLEHRRDAVSNPRA